MVTKLMGSPAGSTGHLLVPVAAGDTDPQRRRPAGPVLRCARLTVSGWEAATRGSGQAARPERHHAHWQRGLSSSLGRLDYPATPGRHVPRSWLRPARRRPAAGGRADNAQRVPARPAADAAAEVRRARRRATGPPWRGTVHDVTARPGPACGRGGTRLVPPPIRRARPTQALPERGRPPTPTSTGRSLTRLWSRRRGRRGARRSPSLSSSPVTTTSASSATTQRVSRSPARAARAHDRGVRPPQRARRPAPRAHRRARRPVAPATRRCMQPLLQLTLRDRLDLWRSAPTRRSARAPLPAKALCAPRRTGRSARGSPSERIG
jgi:hypothetical protein